MVHTLHRYGSRESLADDWVAMALVSKGNNDEGSEPKLQAFLRAAAKYNPVNMRGSSTGQGAMYRDDFSRTPTPEEIVNEVTKPGSVTAVFDKRENLEAFLEELGRLDLGLSVNISAPTKEALESALKAGIVPHSVTYSLGFRGQVDRLPGRPALELSTMCGHGMICGNFANKMVRHVKEEKLSPEKASKYISKLCPCGIVNVTRAQKLLEEARTANISGQAVVSRK